MTTIPDSAPRTLPTDRGTTHGLPLLALLLGGVALACSATTGWLYRAHPDAPEELVGLLWRGIAVGATWGVLPLAAWGRARWRSHRGTQGSDALAACALLVLLAAWALAYLVLRPHSVTVYG